MKIVLIGNFGAENIGDELILSGMISFLRSINENIKLTALSANPEDTKQKHQINSTYKFPAGFRSVLKLLRLRKTLKEVKSADYVIVGGGGLFFGAEKKGTKVWLIQCILSLFLKKKILMLGQSVGTIEKGISKKLFKHVLSKSAFISVRDIQSKKRLEEITNHKIYLQKDFAIFTSVQKNLLESKNIVFVPRKHSDFTIEKINIIKDFLIKKEKEGYKVTILPFSLKHDLEISQKLVHDTNFTLKKISSFSEMESYFKENNFSIIAMRLHSQILALKYNKKLIAISYHSKIDDLLRCYQQKFIELKEVSKENLVKNFITTNNASYLYQTEHQKFIKEIKKFLT